MALVIAPGGYPHAERYPGQDYADPGGLTGLAALLDEQDVRSLLLERSPQLFADPKRAVLLRNIARGVGAEVEQITNGVPDNPAVLRLAVWAVALGVASNVETALHPEQQLGDQARAQLLQARYLGVRAQLAQAAGTGTGGAGGPVAAPRAAGFPPAQGWPEPAAPSYGAGLVTIPLRYY